MERDGALPQFMTPPEVADLLRYAHSTVLRWIHSGKVQATRSPGGTYRIPISEVELLMRANTSAAADESAA